MTSIDGPSVITQWLAWPSIITWERMEGRPRTDDMSRALQAEVRDAMWMLSRQWQMGEFIADDGGTAVPGLGSRSVPQRSTGTPRVAARPSPTTIGSPWRRWSSGNRLPSA
ncbi:MAG: hypothetical protein ACFCVK_19665 [Acidimicrobiales bacterium]